MKVRDFAKKINYGTAKLPVYIQEGLKEETRRKLISFDYADYYYDEKDWTLMSITLDVDKIIVHYKRGEI